MLNDGGFSNLLKHSKAIEILKIKRSFSDFGIKGYLNNFFTLSAIRDNDIKAVLDEAIECYKKWNLRIKLLFLLNNSLIS